MHWRDDNGDDKYCVRRQSKKGGLMVCGCPHVRGKSNDLLTDGRMDNIKYIDVVNAQVKSFIEEFCVGTFML